MSAFTPGPWHYAGGAVWASPADAENPRSTCIAQRGWQKTGALPEQFEPTTKDANLRLCSFSPALLTKLEQVADMLEYVVAMRGRVDGADAEVTEARALIARAKGEAS